MNLVQSVKSEAAELHGNKRNCSLLRSARPPDRKEAAERDVSGWEDVLNCTFNRFSRFSTEVEGFGLVRKLENNRMHHTKWSNSVDVSSEK